MKNKKYWFFGSKLNMVLLAILIILMVIALKWMHENKAIYTPLIQNPTPAIHQEAQIEGNKGDLVSFSIKPGQEVSGTVQVNGSVKGGYFFEGNIMLNILNTGKKVIQAGYAKAITDWMTSEAVSFQGEIDLSGLPKGPAYIELHNDNASGLPQNDKSILIPIIIK